MALRCDQILIDYLSFTVPSCNIYPSDGGGLVDVGQRLLKKLLLSGYDYEVRRGLYGYNRGLWYHGITVCYGGADTVYVQLSGTGCRAMETLHPGLTWERYIGYIKDTYGIHVSRLDVAYDTYDKLDVGQIIDVTNRGRYVSTWRTYLCQQGNKELAVIWGSPQSDCRLRIYDKTLERQRAKCEDVPAGWVRCELQMRNQVAQSWVREMLCGVPLSRLMRGVLKDKLLYVRIRGTHGNPHRLYGWWRSLLDDLPAIHLVSRPGVEYNLERLERYVYTQAASSVRALAEIKGWDTIQQQAGLARLNDRQETLLAFCRDWRRAIIPGSNLLLKNYIIYQDFLLAKIADYCYNSSIII